MLLSDETSDIMIIAELLCSLENDVKANLMLNEMT